MSPKESIDWLLQGHLTGIIFFGEVTTIQAGVFNFRDLQLDTGHVPESIQIQEVKFRWLYHKTERYKRGQFMHLYWEMQ